MFRLKMMIVKAKAAAVGLPVYKLTIFGYFLTYFLDNLGQEITWCWCSLKLEGLLVAGSCNGVVEIDNGSSANFSDWVSDILKSTFPISLDNRETSANVEKVGSSTLLDENGESGWCNGSALSLVVIFWSLMMFYPRYFLSGWWLLTLELSFNTNLGIIVITFEEKSEDWSNIYWPAMFKMIWTTLGVFAHLKCFPFSRWTYRNCFQALSRFLLHSHSLDRKNPFAKIDPIFKYVVLWHNDLNIDDHYDIPKLRMSFFPM